MVKILPGLDWNIGFPQRQRVAISTNGILKAYDFLWRWNESDAPLLLLVCDITRVEDSAIMWRGVVHKLNPIEIKDPARYDVQFTIMAQELSKTLQLLEVWVYEE